MTGPMGTTDSGTQQAERLLDQRERHHQGVLAERRRLRYRVSLGVWALVFLAVHVWLDGILDRRQAARFHDDTTATTAPAVYVMDPDDVDPQRLADALAYLATTTTTTAP